MGKINNFYQAIFENQPNLILVINDQGNIETANNKIEPLLGYHRNEVAGLKFKDLIHSDDLKYIFPFLKKDFTETDGIIQQPLRMVHRDGSIRKVLIDASILNHNNKKSNWVVCSVHSNEKLKPAEASLKRVLQWYNAIFEGSSDAIFISDENSKFVSVNQAACDLTGYSKDELLTMTIPDLHEEVDLDAYRIYHEKIMSGHSMVTEAKILTKNGNKIDTEFSNRRIFVSNYSFMHTTARNLYDRKQAEKALRESEEKYRMVVDTANEGIVVIQDGVFRFINPIVVKMFGDSLQKILGKPFIDFIHPQDRNMVVTNYKKRLRGEEVPNIYTFRGVNSTGEIKWIEINAVIIDWNGKPATLNFVNDITKRKEMEEALKKSEFRFRSLVETSLVGIFQCDLEGKFYYVNKAMSRLLGYNSTNEILSVELYSLFKNPDKQESMLKILQKLHRLDNYELEMVTKQGRARSVLSNITLVGNVLFGMIIDITARKKIEKKLSYRITLEKLISSVSTNFINLSASEIDLTIDHALATIGGFAEVDRVYIFNLSESSTTLNNTYEWCADGIESQKENLQNIPTHSIPWWMENLNNLDIIYIPDVNKLPPEAGAEKKILEGQQIKSLVVVPLVYNKKLVGFLGFDSVRMKKTWDEEDIILLKMFGEIIVNALEHKNTENALYESEKRYRQVVEHATEIIFTTDVKGYFQFGNRAGEILSGYTRVELENSTFYELIESEYRDKIKKHLKNQVRKNIPTSYFEYPFISKSGNKVWLAQNTSLIFDDHKIVGFHCVARDITERKKMEEALRESEERFRSLFENAVVGLYRTSPDGTILIANPTLVNMLGYNSFEDLTKLNLEEAQVKPSYSRSEFKKRIHKDGQIIGMESLWYRKDGSKLYVSESARCFKDDRGNVIYYEGTVEDITERKLLEEQLHQSQKMEAIGHLAGGIAHDFNNLLTVINGYSDFILAEMQPDNPVYNDIQEIYDAGKRAADLTRQLLAFSRRQILKVSVVDLNEIVHNLEKMLRRIIGENIKLVTIYDQNLKSVKVDPGQIEQIIVNLVVNAKDALPMGGTLTIETENVFLDQDYTKKHQSMKSGHYVRLAISDTGMGMSKKIQDKIFEPFFTTKEKGKGTGLGLATVYGIVKQSGGYIWVYSEEGQGTSFKIYFPQTDQEPSKLSDKNRKAALPSGKETVLVVEDDRAVRAMATKTLKRQLYTVLTAKNGEEAIKICENCKTPIDLLVTDVVMPGISGKELSERVSRLLSDIKILYISGYTDNAIVHHGVLEPGMKFLQKPFTPENLASKVRKILDGKE